MATSGRTNLVITRPYQRPATDLIHQAHQGVLRRRVDEVARLIGLTDKEMAHILNMSVRNLHGKAETDSLSLSASERLLLLERLLQHGLMVFGGRADLVNRWLHTPLPELSYRETPFETGQPAPVRALGSFQEPTPTYDRPAVPTPQEPLGEVVPQSPLAVLDTVSGFSVVDDVLGRIEWGIVG
ncbi:antitoxin Xre-like helix-turn-helix domain-containing protein [Spirosoma montaniterrae]|uniref:Antitoxin Xre-like helix-turn-helix domain-containing protein n=1 Tax=Spirosoma montaniterrae TaxID=1178516 RepID=A0A1P9X0P9_9BACT|nr:antitoxin Xre-like helix-turn-helix domain-containing protein [Spirosoma montaniterrae]AQG81211.1 hypothetical protein AWR27_18925 [Spirosoma montaniterrae]